MIISRTRELQLVRLAYTLFFALNGVLPLILPVEGFLNFSSKDLVPTVAWFIMHWFLSYTAFRIEWR